LEQGLMIVTMMKSLPSSKKKPSELIFFLLGRCGKLHQFYQGRPIQYRELQSVLDLYGIVLTHFPHVGNTEAGTTNRPLAYICS
jgi:hypothetical protein